MMKSQTELYRPISYIYCYVSGGGLECVAGLAHTAQVRLGTPISNPTLSATCT